MRDKDRHVEKKCFNQGVGVVDIKIQDCPLKEGNLEMGLGDLQINHDRDLQERSTWYSVQFLKFLLLKTACTRRFSSLS